MIRSLAALSLLSLLSLLALGGREALSQEPTDARCPLSNNFEVSVERRLIVNPKHIEKLIKKPSVAADIAGAQEAFIQTVIAAADRLNLVGSSTFVYAGRTTLTNLPNDYTGDCLDPNKRHLIVISDGFHPFGWLAQVEPKCKGPDGVFHGFRVVFYVRSKPSADHPWSFAYNGLDNNLSALMLHELGHTFRVEHADQVLPPSAPSPLMRIYPPQDALTLREWDLKCMRYRGETRRFSLLFREVTSEGIGPEEVYLNTVLGDGVEDFAPGQHDLYTLSVQSLIYERISAFAPDVTRWHMDTLGAAFQDLKRPPVGDAFHPSFQVWVSAEAQPVQRPKYLWARADSSSAWDDDWRVMVKTYQGGAWSPPLAVSTDTPLRAEFAPSIAHLRSPLYGLRTLSVWSALDQTVWIGSGTRGENVITGAKPLRYRLPNGREGAPNPSIPPSIACRPTDGLCVVAFIANDQHDAAEADPTAWRDKNVIKIGYVILAELMGPRPSTTLWRVHELPRLSSAPYGPTRMKTASRPTLLYDGLYFRVIFRNSHWEGQKLTAFKSTDAYTWTYDPTFESSPGFNHHRSYSAVPPAAPTYRGGPTRLYYSRPYTHRY